jgi:hypothetical protein
MRLAASIKRRSAIERTYGAILEDKATRLRAEDLLQAREHERDRLYHQARPCCTLHEVLDRIRAVAVIGANLHEADLGSRRCQLAKQMLRHVFENEVG